MDGAKVTKVQCKECMGYHRYRTPPGEENVNRPKAKAASTSRRKVSSKEPKRATGKSSRRADEPLVSPDLSRPVRGYSIRETYEPGERIAHPSFGQGVVEAVPEAGKVSVYFEGGRRTLAHGRALSPGAAGGG